MSARIREAADLIRMDVQCGGCTGAKCPAPDADFYLAVAAWLTDEADEYDRRTTRADDPRFMGAWLDVARQRHQHAVTVANAYLGGLS